MDMHENTFSGEDGGEASSAGQMETYLGVRGREKILEAIKKCWASAYTYQAVQYRRYNTFCDSSECTITLLHS